MNKPFNKSENHRRFKRKRNDNRNKKDVFEDLLPLKPNQKEQLIRSIVDNEFIVFDIETTGGNPEKNGITEIAALRWKNGQIVDRFYTLVNPQVRIPPIVRRMTGIHFNMVKDAPIIDKVMPEFIEFIGESILVSHNIIGDLKFLRYFAFKTTKLRMHNLFICTHLLSERIYNESSNKSLLGLAKHIGIEANTVHRAQEDADITLGLFKALLNESKKLRLESLEDLIRFQKDLESGLRLGWPFSQQIMHSLPKGPGCLLLMDGCEHKLFACASSNLYRLVMQMQKFPQMPRQILRLLLRAKHLKFFETKNFFEAMMIEAQLLTQNKELADPLTWRQRFINIVSLRKHDNEIVMKIEPFYQSVAAALGPASDVVKFSNVIKNYARLVNKKYSAKGTIFNMHEAEDLVEILRNNIDERLKKSKLPFWKLLNPFILPNYLQERRLLTKLRKLQTSPPLKNVLDLNGYLFVNNSHPHQCTVYEIRHSLPVSKRDYGDSAHTIAPNFDKEHFHKSKKEFPSEDSVSYKRAVAWFVLQKGSIFLSDK